MSGAGAGTSSPIRTADCRAPSWRGQPLAGKTVVVYAEQGYGDTIQFAPLARRLAEQAGEVLFEVTTPQVRLFKEGFAGGNLEVVERTRNPDIIATLKPYHYVVPLMSLPARLSLSLGDLPLCGPYIKPPTAARAQWAKRFAGAKGCKIGLAWAGRPTHAEDRKRSLTLERLRALFLVQGISWYSLQVGPASAQIAETKLPLVDLAPHFNDFADTAAIIELSVVIAVDTAVAHLGAAMGKSVWILLPRSPTGAGCRRAPTARGIRACASSASPGSEIGIAWSPKCCARSRNSCVSLSLSWKENSTALMMRPSAMSGMGRCC